MKHLIKTLLLLLITSCSAQESASDTDFPMTLIKDVKIIDVSDGSIAEGMSVLVKNGMIKAIAKEINQGDATIIDGNGGYLMPGLAEMHAHIPSPQWGRDRTDETLFLYLSNGVTTIRGMLGHPEHLKLRSQAANNEILSPRIFTSSPSVNGNSVKTKAEAREKITQFKADGYDFLKIHPGLKLEVFNEIVKTANEVGIGFSGHVPVDVGIRHAIASGYGSIDHVDGFLEGLVPESANVAPDQNGFFGYSFTHLADRSKIGELVALTKMNKVWVVPTQSLFVRWFSPVDPEEIKENDPDFKYMPKSTVTQWVNSKKNLIGDPEFTVDKFVLFTDIRHELIKKLHANGHGLLLGSDAPQVFNVPGFSIHHELNGIIEAGLTPLEAIQTGTINPAIFFEMEGEFGEVKEGASADLILLNNNPLEDIKNLKNPEGVMVRGRWLDRIMIDAKLAEIAERSKDI
ncbi:amidohydrolase family protein [Ekhidna sp. To15]|uniref:amidohydrolase family protein n=1 Tax=Ekhidna sp. To15 TaxID=3395267 RepID=UPI003F51ECB1